MQHVQQLMDFLKTNATSVNILATCACVYAVLTAVGNFLKLIAPKGSKMAHFADLLLVAAADVGKLIDTLKKLFAKAPPVIGGPLAAVAIALGLTFAAPARAQVIYSYGATADLVSIDLRTGTASQVGAGAGAQVAFSLKSLQREMAGRLWDLLDLDVMVLGTRITGPAGVLFGDLAGGIAVGTFSNLLSVGVAKGLTGHAFALLSLNLNFAGGILGGQPPGTSGSNFALTVAKPELPRGNMLFQ